MPAMQCVFGSLYGNRKVLDEPYLRPIKIFKLVIYIYIYKNIFLKCNIINLSLFQTAITLPDKSITNILKLTNQPKKKPQTQKKCCIFFLVKNSSLNSIFMKSLLDVFSNSKHLFSFRVKSVPFKKPSN